MGPPDAFGRRHEAVLCVLLGQARSAPVVRRPAVGRDDRHTGAACEGERAGVFDDQFAARGGWREERR